MARLARVYLPQFNLKKAFEGKRRISEDALFDSKTSLIITWAGMRGIVSLAIALGLPLTLSGNTAFPMRDEIIFISIAVVLFSLLGQGLTLPWIVKKFGGNKEDKAALSKADRKRFNSARYAPAYADAIMEALDPINH